MAMPWYSPLNIKGNEVTRHLQLRARRQVRNNSSHLGDEDISVRDIMKGITQLREKVDNIDQQDPGDCLTPRKRYRTAAPGRWLKAPVCEFASGRWVIALLDAG
ncbi:hypothetical protein CRENBAI_017208 [Crenichthys baileyi]|uniref:Uncharacterized protein n=1 Tax=Crenichthys baileyi TaxID=28760 RepID=A0AAV9RCK1_9TELE